MGQCIKRTGEKAKQECLKCPICLQMIADTNTGVRMWNKARLLDQELVRQGKAPAFQKELQARISPIMGIKGMAKEAAIYEPVLDHYMWEFGLSGEQGRKSLNRMALEASRGRA